MGSGYIIDHCVAALNSMQKRDNLETYLTDCFFALNNNIANAWGGITITERWYNINHPAPIETRTEEEIVEGIQAKLRMVK